MSVQQVLDHIIFRNYLLSSELEALVVFSLYFFFNKLYFDGKTWADLRFQSEPKAL